MQLCWMKIDPYTLHVRWVRLPSQTTAPENVKRRSRNRPTMVHLESGARISEELPVPDINVAIVNNRVLCQLVLQYPQPHAQQPPWIIAPTAMPAPPNFIL